LAIGLPGSAFFAASFAASFWFFTHRARATFASKTIPAPAETMRPGCPHHRSISTPFSTRSSRSSFHFPSSTSRFSFVSVFGGRSTRRSWPTYRAPPSFIAPSCIRLITRSNPRPRASSSSSSSSSRANGGGPAPK
jgi:hypothetical protein